MFLKHGYTRLVTGGHYTQNFQADRQKYEGQDFVALNVHLNKFLKN